MHSSPQHLSQNHKAERPCTSIAWVLAKIDAHPRSDSRMPAFISVYKDWVYGGRKTGACSQIVVQQWVSRTSEEHCRCTHANQQTYLRTGKKNLVKYPGQNGPLI